MNVTSKWMSHQNEFHSWIKFQMWFEFILSTRDICDIHTWHSYVTWLIQIWCFIRELNSYHLHVTYVTFMCHIHMWRLYVTWLIQIWCFICELNSYHLHVTYVTFICHIYMWRDSFRYDVSYVNWIHFISTNECHIWMWHIILSHLKESRMNVTNECREWMWHIILSHLKESRMNVTNECHEWMWHIILSDLKESRHIWMWHMTSSTRD